LKDHEVILRFFALYFGRDGYHRPVKSFLNKFLSDNRDFQRYDENILTVTFETTTTAVLEGIGPRAFRPRTSLNAAVADSVMVGVATRLESGPITDWPSLREAYSRLIANPDYRFVVESSTAAEESVETRLRMAQEYFSSVE